jgi:hypothetical protein
VKYLASHQRMVSQIFSFSNVVSVQNNRRPMANYNQESDPQGAKTNERGLIDFYIPISGRATAE